jgi:uncharacterized delta-60 repeat protein
MLYQLKKISLYALACFVILRCGSGICPMGGCKVSAVSCASSYGYTEPTGVLDTSFNSTGILSITPVGGNNNITESVYLTSDCKILMGIASSTAARSYIYKYNTDGTLDTSFGTNGILLADTQVGGTFILKPNGKFIVISASGNTYRFKQYTANGVLDTSFSPPTITFPAYNVLGRTGLLADGSYLLMFDQRYVYKFDATGNLDTTFATAGLLTTGLTTTGVYQRSGLRVDSSNRILVGGNDGTNFKMQRYSSSGVLDTTFGTAGSVTTAVSGAATSHIADIRILSSGNILAGGFDSTGAAAGFAFARYDANGNIDTTFGTAGSYAMGGGFNRHAWYGVNLQVDATSGKFYMACIDGGWSNSTLVRFNANGGVDTTFATAGYFARTDAPGDTTTLLVTPWGKLVMVGGTSTIIRAFMVK